MIDREHELPLTRQAAVLKLSRSGLYYRARPVAPADLAVMRRIDELHLDYPFAGSRMLRDLLRGEGVAIGRQRAATMMKRMGITALYRRPNASKPAPGHKIYPYLLRSVAVERPNQAWAMDITYIPMARGFVYLAAVVDWFSRRDLAHSQNRGLRSGSSRLFRSGHLILLKLLSQYPGWFNAILSGAPTAAARPGAFCWSATTEEEPKNGSDADRGKHCAQGPIGCKLPYVIQDLPVQVLRLPGSLVSLAARLGRSVACHCANGILQLATDIARDTFRPVLVDHLNSPLLV